MKIGIYSGGFKPLTKGHFDVILNASKENDEVKVFVSTKDRARKGEFPIYWDDMKVVWSKYINNVLPDNVSVEFVDAPIAPMMNILSTAVQEQQNGTNNNIYTIYTDINDFNNIFDKKRLEKYSELIADGKLKFSKYKRGDATTNISGTLMRKFLEMGSLENFTLGLPKPLQPYAKIIFKQLGGIEV